MPEIGLGVGGAAERGERPDVVHAHDWQTAPCTWEDLAGAKTAFTIHNLEYGADLIGGAMAVRFAFLFLWRRLVRGSV